MDEGDVKCELCHRNIGCCNDPDVGKTCVECWRYLEWAEQQLRIAADLIKNKFYS